MTREEKLVFCKVCKNQKFDMNQGVQCGLTNAPADFKGTCEHYDEDSQLLFKQDLNKIEKELLTREAGLSKRFANFLLDGIFMVLMGIVFGFLLGVVLAMFSPDSLSFFETDNFFLEYFLNFLIGMVYYSFFEAMTGQTPAKYITKTRVVNEEGEKPDMNTILIRSLCRYIPFEPFSFLGSDNRGWHDTISKTQVIEV
jgi:uncharacterized RDD family membrane protein YckC